MSIYAVRYTYDSRAAARDEIRPEHRAYLSGLVDQQIILGSGPFAGGEGALLVLRTTDRAELDALLAADPFALAGLIAGTEVQEWDPVLGPWAQDLAR